MDMLQTECYKDPSKFDVLTMKGGRLTRAALRAIGLCLDCPNLEPCRDGVRQGEYRDVPGVIAALTLEQRESL